MKQTAGGMAVVLAFTIGAPATADTLQWNQDSDGQSFYGPSVKSSTVDREIADDFFFDGSVTRILAQGGQGFPAPPPVTVSGVEVRFYGVAADGRPGPVLAEYLLAADDPNLSFTQGNPGTFDITLSPPFEADGQHFVGVQAVMESYWNRYSSNGFGHTRGSHFWIRDNLAGGTWEVYEDVHGQHFDDIVFELYGDLGGPAVVTGLSEASVTNSGRLRIEGWNLGGTRNGGVVRIGGRSAWVAEWTDRAIHAYAPEGISGPSGVVIETVAGAGAPSTVGVVPRIPDGQVRWRFACDSLYARQRVGIGPDGTIYAQDVDGILYALSPDGALLWLLQLDGQGSEGPVAVGPDGVVYVGANPAGPESHLVAVNPDGTILWTYTVTGSQGLLAGPGVGPDGRVYAVWEQPGGAVALDPLTGAESWFQPGSPAFNEHGQLGQEIGFGVERFFVAFDERAFNATSLWYGLSYDGSQDFALGRPDDNAYVVVGPEGNVYMRTWFSSAGIRLVAYDQDGNQLWVAFDSPTNVLSDPSPGPDGAVYVVRNLNQLWALEPDGSTRWMVTTDGSLRRPVPSPSGDRLVVGGSVTGSQGFVRAYDTTGNELWETILPDESDGARLAPTAPARFDPTGATAYLPVSRNWNPPVDERCYIYSLALGETGIFSDGFESGDTSRWTATEP